MASFNSVNYSASGVNTGSRVASASVAPEIRYKKANYVSIATQAANDTINLVKLPKGAKVRPEISFISRNGAAAATLTIDVGDSGDPDRYSDGFNAAAAGCQSFTTPAVPDGAINRYTLPDETTIVATIATIGTPAAGVEIEFLIAYELPAA